MNKLIWKQENEQKNSEGIGGWIFRVEYNLSQFQGCYELIYIHKENKIRIRETSYREDILLMKADLFNQTIGAAIENALQEYKNEVESERIRESLIGDQLPANYKFE